MTLRHIPKIDVSARTGVRTEITAAALQRWSPDVCSAVGESDDASISILDQIGGDWYGDGVTAKRIAAALRAVGDRPVTVNINSPGGDYFEGLAIYNLLREHKASVTVNILGIAASAASVIAMAGDSIHIARAGFIMIHNTWVCACGDRNALREVADWLEPFDAAAVDVYGARTGIDAKTLTAMLDKETWISGSAAVEKGFADDLLTSDAIGLDPSQSGNAAIRAEKKLDILARKAGLSRAEAQTVLSDIKGGMRGAAPAGQRDAPETVSQLVQLRDQLKSFLET